MESVWTCTCLGKVRETSVTAGSDDDGDDGGYRNMECIQELLVSNARMTACLGIKHKPLLEGLVYFSVGGV
jgi:hypothetical protein